MDLVVWMTVCGNITFLTHALHPCQLIIHFNLMLFNAAINQNNLVASNISMIAQGGFVTIAE